MAYEEQLIRRIEGGLGALKRKEKTAQELKLGSAFNALKPINPNMYEDLLAKYKKLTTEPQ